jgi:hypothetical protein
MEGGEDAAVDIKSFHGGNLVGGAGDGARDAARAASAMEIGVAGAQQKESAPPRRRWISPELRHKLLLRGFPVRARRLRGSPRAVSSLQTLAAAPRRGAGPGASSTRPPQPRARSSASQFAPPRPPPIPGREDSRGAAVRRRGAHPELCCAPPRGADGPGLGPAGHLCRNDPGWVGGLVGGWVGGWVAGWLGGSLGPPLDGRVRGRRGVGEGESAPATGGCPCKAGGGPRADRRQQQALPARRRPGQRKSPYSPLASPAFPPPARPHFGAAAHSAGGTDGCAGPCFVLQRLKAYWQRRS